MRDWLNRFDDAIPLRYAVWLLCAVGLLLSAFAWVAFDQGGLLVLLFGALTVLGWRDTLQTRHSVLRNYPVIGHMRYLFEYIRPEIRQYFIEPDNEAAPFSRQQRSLIYQRAKGDSDKRPFGTQLDVYAHGYEWINHSMAPTALPTHDFRVTIGAGRDQPYSASVFNISAMSFGSLSANAILALNEGATRGNFAHDTGEGSISRYHREHGGDLIWEIGSGYFGCRDHDGSFNAESFAANARSPQVKMIELKLSQGAKPGHGGVLPGPKVTPEIASARDVPVGVDCISPGQPLGLLHAARNAAVHRAAAHAVRRQADRLQAVHRPPLGVVRDLQGDAGDRHRARLHRRRRRRRRHRRGAAGVHRPRRRAAAGRAAAGAQHAGRLGAARSRQDRLRRQDGHRLRHRAHDGARRRLVQRRARLHVRAGLPAVADLPHRGLSDRRDDAGPAAPEARWSCPTRPNACTASTRTR